MVGFHMGLLTYELGSYWQKADPEQIKLGRKYFYDILTSVDPLGKIEKMSSWENWKSGISEGILFGGNLSMIDSLIGTPYFPNLDTLKGATLFWELDNSPTYRIERILTHLKYAGVLGVISGMIIGKLVDMKPSTNEFAEPSLKEIVVEVLKDFSFPVLANVDFGHKMVQIPMPIGVKVKMDSDNLNLHFLESAVI
jgi:muramoyltetrapeptide carboxypeptidase